MNTINKNKKLLKGIRVLDFSRILVGAYASMLLADLGAEVIKVEPPGGDETRKWGPPFRNEDSLYFLSINRNKKSISIDLKKEESQVIARQLIEKSDILIENFPFGKMKRFGLDYDSVKNNKLIYTTVNSYGNKGPLKSTPSFDLITQAYTGVMNITGRPDTEPFKVGFPVLDIMAGSHTYGAIMTGLLHRSLRGEGQYINTSLLESNLFAMPTIVSTYLNAGVDSTRRGNDHPTISPYTVFRLTLTGIDYVSIGVATDLQFVKLWKVLNLEGVYNFGEFATNSLRLENRDKLKEIIQNSIYTFNQQDLFDSFSSNGIPFSKINSMKDIFDHNKQIEELEMVREISTEDYGQLKYVRNPVTYSTIQLEDIKSPPKLGNDTKNVLKNILKMDDVNIDNLYKNKIVF